MVAVIRNRLFAFALAVVAMVGVAGSGEAGWIVLKNETNKTVVVQETINQNGTEKRGKPIRLLPGESVKQFYAGPLTAKVEVFDGQNTTKSLFTGNITHKGEDQTFSVATDGKAVFVAPKTTRSTDDATAKK